MNNFLALLEKNDALSLAAFFGLTNSDDEFSAKLTKTKKLVLRQHTNGGKNKKTAVVNKNRTVLYQSLPNKKS